MFEAFYPGEELDLATIERHAYADGDMLTAQLAAVALDAEEIIKEAEEIEREREAELEVAADEAERNYSECQEAWSDHNGKMRTKLEALSQMIEIAARVSGREVLLARIEECIALIDDAER